MQISKREFLKQLALLGTSGAAAVSLGDEYVSDSNKLPPGSCGDPDCVWFGRHIFPLKPTLTDGPSCSLKDGKVIEPSKEIPIYLTTDVVVVGGGPAGFAAALAAARTGAKVALVERYGSLGGLFTNGLVLIVLATSRRAENGQWDLVTRGITEEFMTRAGQFGTNFSSPSMTTCPKSPWQPTVDPECAKYLMDTMVAEESRIEMFFHAWGIDVIQEGPAVRGIVFESKEGRQAILAKEVVDTTGDADMLFKAGGAYRQITSSMTTVFRWANMNTIHPQPGQRTAFRVRGNEGNPDAFWGGASMNTANALSVRDLTRFEISERRKNWETVQKMRATPGWEQVYTSSSASQIGVRGTRLVETEFVTGRVEIAAGYEKGDTVGWCGEGSGHAAFPVVYRQLVPKTVEHLICAGRCLGTGDTIDQFRLIAPCFMTGEAAGTAAALCALRGVSPRQLDPHLLRRTLAKRGAYLVV